MKNKILTFIIGILVGATIATVGFYVYAKTMNLNNKEVPGMMKQEGGTLRPEKPSEFEGQNQGEPPEIPLNNRNSI